MVQELGLGHRGNFLKVTYFPNVMSRHELKQLDSPLESGYCNVCKSDSALFANSGSLDFDNSLMHTFLDDERIKNTFGAMME